jgi:hypothetical protein
MFSISVPVPWQSFGPRFSDPDALSAVSSQHAGIPQSHSLTRQKSTFSPSSAPAPDPSILHSRKYTFSLGRVSTRLQFQSRLVSPSPARRFPLRHSAAYPISMNRRDGLHFPRSPDSPRTQSRPVRLGLSGPDIMVDSLSAALFPVNCPTLTVQM